ncbi:MAG: VOC family protein [Sphingomonas sp.]
MPPVPQLEIVQNCYVVRNLELACAQMHQAYGLGPFVGGGVAQLDDHIYRGKPAEPIRLRGVFVQSGNLNIELIELVSTTPSAFHDMFPDGQEGLHHVATFSPDYDRDQQRLVAMGFPVASEFTTVFGARICYLDARAAFGHMIEMYPENAVIRGMYAQTVRERDDWTGSPLIVPWD